MWLATKAGFFSIVRKENEDFHVRARLRSDIEELIELTGIKSEIFESEFSDYRFRIVVNENTVRRIGSRLFEEIDYDNFKNRIYESPTQMGKGDAYGTIWSTMQELQEGYAR